MKQFDRCNISEYTYKTSKVIKLIFFIFLLCLILLLKTEVYANLDEIGIYGKDNFGEEYSNGYIRDRSSDNVIGLSSGVSIASHAGYTFYTSNNTSKSEYIDYSEVARTINSNGESVWLDMRLYMWSNDPNYFWNIRTTNLCIVNVYDKGKVHTNCELHFYTAGHCGDSNYEKTFNGVIKITQLDALEGIRLYSGYNKFYLKEGEAVIGVLPREQNSANSNNPFDKTGISQYPYFFGTRSWGATDSSVDSVWIEVESTPISPFRFTHGTEASLGMFIFYTGTPIEYYVDGELKDTSYCVPYGTYKLINPRKMDSTKEGYTVDGWYTDISYTTKVQNGIAGESTIKVYGKSIPDKRYTITVDNEREGHTYNSYQVFEGNYYDKIDGNGNKVPTLSNIEWGYELQKQVEEGKTHGDKILELLKEKNLSLYKDCNTAEDVAKVLQGKPNDGEAIKEFTNIVGKYILDNNIPVTNGTSTVVDEKDINGNVIDKNYKITHLEPGYYIVIDAETNKKDDAYSRYLIDVVQDVTMYPKTSVPRLNKKVIGNNIKKQVEGTGASSENPAQYIEDEKRNTATYKLPSENYNVSDYDIEFELKSYIPDVTGYSAYKFEVVDILSKGFDYDRNSVKVMLEENLYPQTRINESGETVNNYTVRDVVIDASNYETYKKYFEEEGKTYPEEYAESNYGKTLILVELNDLVEQVKESIVEKGQDIFVRYNAKLNGKGEIGNTPNINEAYVKYSNDPYHNDKESQTTTQTTYTYTIDLDLIKIAELKDESSIINYLEGAELEIYNKPETDKDRKLIATVTTNDLGKALYSSLGVGTYYIKETKSPEGYNKLREEIVIEVRAICDEYGTITWTVEEKNNNNLLLAQIGIKEGTEIPEIKLQVENTSGLQLPVTGGKGIAIFIIVGLIMMGVTIVNLKTSNKV